MAMAAMNMGVGGEGDDGDGSGWGVARVGAVLAARVLGRSHSRGGRAPARE